MTQLPAASLKRLVVLVAPAPTSPDIHLRWAVALAEQWDVDLKLLHILDPARVAEPVEVARVMASDYLALAVSALQGETARNVEVEVREGLLAEEWGEAVRAVPGSVLVTTDLEGLGKIVAPVLVVPPHSGPPRRVDRIIVGTDGGDLSERILSFARAATVVPEPSEPGWAPYPPRIIEVEAIERGYVPDHQFVQLQPQISQDRVSIRGKAEAVVLGVARLLQGEMIVVGTHGRGGGLLGRFFGSTSRWLASNSDRPVLIIPEPDQV